jgi:hypothetical protein
VSIKDELNYVKAELSADEKVLESAFRIESFLKKHKIKLISVTVAAIVAAVAYNGYNAYKASKLEAANQALLTLQTNPKDKAAEALLKANAPLLYAHYVLWRAVKNGDINTVRAFASSQEAVIADMARYHTGAMEKKPTNSELYRELALLEEAYLALKKGDIASAKAKLELIDERSPAASAAALLRHATVTKGK